MKMYDRCSSKFLKKLFVKGENNEMKSLLQDIVKDESGKFKVTTFQGMNVIGLDNGAYYTSYGNDSIGELAGAGSTFEYQG